MDSPEKKMLDTAFLKLAFQIENYVRPELGGADGATSHIGLTRAEWRAILAGLKARPEGGALKVIREMIRGNPIEHAIVDLAEPDVGLGAWLDRRLDMNSDGEKR